MIILCILIFSFALFTELMKMNNGEDADDEKIYILAKKELEDSGEEVWAVLLDLSVLWGV